jgi:hypothetical protein
VPDIPGADTDYKIEISREGEIIKVLDGAQHEWTPFYEEFAGDNYYSGPEHTQEVQAGTYNLEVSSSDNRGKYVLVVGQKEEFPINEFVNTIVTLPRLKQYFGKPAYTAYFNLIGVSLLVIIGVIAGLGFVGYKIVKK